MHPGKGGGVRRIHPAARSHHAAPTLVVSDDSESERLLGLMSLGGGGEVGGARIPAVA